MESIFKTLAEQNIENVESHLRELGISVKDKNKDGNFKSMQDVLSESSNVLMKGGENVTEFELVNNITGETVLSGKMPKKEMPVREKLTSLTLQMDDLSVDIYVNEENLNKLVDFGKE